MSNAAIESRVKSFVADLEELVRAAALEAVQRALGATAPASAAAAPSEAPVKRGPGRPPKAATAAKAAATPAAAGAAPAAAPAPKAAAGKRKKGQKRSPAELAALQSKLENYVKSNEGQRIEEIAKALATSTSELTRPMKKLMDEGKVRSTGERRATRYFTGKKK